VTPDLAQAVVFLTALDPARDAFTFQYFQERQDAAVAAAHPHGTLAGLASTLARANEHGAGIFVTVNQTDGAGRTAENIVALRSLFIDCDRPRVRPLALPPSLSVQTSSGRGHHYWLLRPGEPLGAFRSAQARLAAFYGSDPTVTDLGRVLRLPGFFNVKHDPFLVQLVRCRPELRYTIADIVASHPVESHSTPDLVTDPPNDTHPSCAEALYRRWTKRAPFSTGTRNRVAFRLALEGFLSGLDGALVDAEVRAFCERCGISREADAVLRSARKIAARGLRHSSPPSSRRG
jgi:hypothetical protein